MGKKKIEITLIENQKDRGICFNRRLKGVLKKVSELSILCGVNISLVTTDLWNNIHHYSNSNCLSFKIDKQFVNNNTAFRVYSYSKEDYPFDNFRKKDKIVKGKVAKAVEKSRSMMKVLGWAHLNPLNLNPEYFRVNFKSLLGKILEKQTPKKNDKEQESLKWNNLHGKLSSIFRMDQLKKKLNPKTYVKFDRAKEIVQMSATSVSQILHEKIGNSQPTRNEPVKVEYKAQVEKFTDRILNLFCDYQTQGDIPFIMLIYLVKAYFSEEKNNLSLTLQNIPRREMLKIIDISDTGYLFASKDIEFLDFDNTSTSSDFSFKSYFLSTAEKGDSIDKNLATFLKYSHTFDTFDSQVPNSDLIKAMEAVLDVLLRVVIGKIKPDKDFDLIKACKEVSLPSYYFSAQFMCVKIFISVGVKLFRENSDQVSGLSKPMYKSEDIPRFFLEIRAKLPDFVRILNCKFIVEEIVQQLSLVSLCCTLFSATLLKPDFNLFEK